MDKDFHKTDSHNMIITYSLRCKSCGSIMNIQSEKRLLRCPSCGSEEIIIESEAVTIERIRSSTQLAMQREEREYERKKRVYEDAKAERKNKANTKTAVIGALGIIVFILFVGLVNSLLSNSNINAGRINPPVSAKMSVGVDYHIIEQQFRDAGFINVTVRPLGDIHDTSFLNGLDLTKSSLGKYINDESLANYTARLDKIESIMIGNNNSFSKKDWFSPDTNVFIYYHSMEDPDTSKK